MRMLSVISGKGGVGKTTVAANLSVALSKLGFNVTAVDLNVTTPHLGIQFGYYLPEVSLHDILKNVEKLREGIYIHPSGVKLIPGDLNVEKISGLELSNLEKILYNLNSDFVILDSAAGLGREALASITHSHEVLIVTNPDLPSVVDALRVIKIVEKTGKNILGIVLNRVGRSGNELKKETIEKYTNYKVIAQIPEDKWVVKSIEERIPLVYLKPNSKAAIEMMNLAYAILGSTYRKKISLWDRIFSWV